MKTYKKITDLIGNTPLLELENYREYQNLSATIFGKLEYFNPAGSVKDRIAKAMIDDAEAKGVLKPDSVIIEPTSGNTGIGLAAVAAARGYKVILTMPETMSVERRNLLKAYGAQVVLTPGVNGMKGAIQKAQELAAENENSFIPSQFTNSANPRAHRSTTGPEIWNDTDGHVDYFVAMGGTAGTIVGTGRYLREKNPNVKIIGVQAAPTSRPDNPDFTGHIVDGTLPLGRVDESLVPTIIKDNRNNGFEFDEIIDIKAEEAYETAQETAKTDGLFLGTSAAAALTAAIQIAKRPEAAGKNIVVIYADNGYKYLSTDLYKRKKKSEAV